MWMDGCWVGECVGGCVGVTLQAGEVMYVT